MDIRIIELNWYRKNGKYPERIVKDTDNKEYVIGDCSWNRIHKNKPEFVDILMGMG